MLQLHTNNLQMILGHLFVCWPYTNTLTGVFICGSKYEWTEREPERERILFICTLISSKQEIHARNANVRVESQRVVCIDIYCWARGGVCLALYYLIFNESLIGICLIFIKRIRWPFESPYLN